MEQKKNKKTIAPQISFYVLPGGAVCELNHWLVLVVDDDDRKPSIWAHLGCRITVSEGSWFGHLKRPHLLCFVLFQSRVPGVSRRTLSLSTQPFLFWRLLEDLTGAEETNLAATTCAGPPPAAGGRNELRRTAPSLPPRKIQEEEEEDDGGEGNGDRAQKETSSVAAVDGSVKKTNAKVCVIQ